MSENVSLDGSEGSSLQQSDGTSCEQNYSEHDDMHIESDSKSVVSQSNEYLNLGNRKFVIRRVASVLNEKKTIAYEIDNVDGSSADTPVPIRRTCCTVITLLLGILLCAVGFITIAVPLYDFVLEQRLRMHQGLPPFELWVKPAPEVRLSVYLFTVENPDAFLNGTDQKLRFKEIGPIVYREHLHHRNITFHDDNSTLSYTADRHVKLLDEHNEPNILDRVILVPNFVLLATAASLNDNFFYKMGFKNFVGGLEEPLFVNMTIRDYLWSYKSALISRVLDLAPSMVPTNNSGCLYQIYANFKDRYNVRIGPGYSHDHFFEITSVNGESVVPGFNVRNGDCNASIIGSTEGALYKTHLNEESVLWYWRKPLCRQVPLYFEKKVQKGPFEAYKYILRENVYDRFADAASDCYKGVSQLLPDGLSDVSKCFYDMPFAASNPHFFGRYPNDLTKTIEGFEPDKEKHQSYIIVEPVMGVPIDQSARSQSNVIIPELYGFNEKIHRFSNMALPTFWVEYRQKDITPTIERMLYFMLFIFPVLQHVITAVLIITGIYCLTIGVLRCMAKRGHDPSRRSSVLSKTEMKCINLNDYNVEWNLK